MDAVELLLGETSGPIFVSGSRPVAEPACSWPRSASALDELVVDRLLDEQPRAGASSIAPWLKKMPEVRALEGGVQVGVGEDDVRRLAAQLERDALEVAGGRLRRSPADVGRAGEGDLVDVRVAASAAPAVSPKPVTTLNTPSGSRLPGPARPAAAR